MSVISLDKVKNLTSPFLTDYVLPNVSDPWVKVGVAVSALAIPNKFDSMLAEYKSVINFLDLIDANNRLNIDNLKAYFDQAFKYVPEIPLKGSLSFLSLTKEDGEAIIKLLEENKDE